jgi:hypothetical protein
MQHRWQKGLKRIGAVALCTTALWGVWPGLTGAEINTSPAWVVQSEVQRSQFGYVVVPVGDLNGDGYGDVAVGAPGYSGGQATEGAVFVYYGGPQGLQTSPNRRLELDIAYKYLGGAVYRGGDVNNDGYGDLVALGWNGTGVYAWYGSAAGITASPSWVSEMDYAPYSISTAGDVNNDGYDDVIVGSLFTENGKFTGGAYLYYGSAAGLPAVPDWTSRPTTDPNQYAIGVMTAGDVNGDGFDDVLIGDYGYTNGEADEGIVHLHLGSQTGLSANPAWSYESNVEGNGVGEHLASGDVNGDGYSDVILGINANTGDRNAQAAVFYGSAAGLSASPAWTFDLGEKSMWTMVESAGDVNGDGITDLIVGSAYHGSTNVGTTYGVGKVWVLLGGPSGPSAVPYWTATGDQAESAFGWFASGAGDVNNDGLADILVGAPNYDDPSVHESNKYANHGRAYLYLSVATPLQPDDEPPTGEMALLPIPSQYGSSYTDPETGLLHTNSRMLILQLNAKDNRGVAQARFSEDGERYGPWEPFAKLKHYTLIGEDGGRSLFVQFRDAAGNASAVSSISFRLDTTAPIAQVEAQVPVGSRLAVSVPWQVDDPGGVGAAGGKLYYTRNGGQTWFYAGESVGAAPFSVTLPRDGQYGFYVRPVDRLGNEGEMPTSPEHIQSETTIDTHRPGVSGMVLKGTVYSSLVTVLVSVTDTGTGLDDVRYSLDGQTWGAWEAYSPIKEFEKAANRLLPTVYLQVRDRAGNISDPMMLDLDPVNLAEIVGADQ